MPIEMTMPRLSDTMEVGTVVKWSVKEGDKVSSGDVVADIETDKATMELQTFDDGTVAKLLVPEGQQVAVGTPILTLAGKGETVEAAAAGAGAGQKQTPSEAGAGAPASRGEGGDVREPAATGSRQGAVGRTGRSEEAGTPVLAASEARGGRVEGRNADRGSRGEHAGGEANGRIFASPLARKMAEQEGIDLARVEGSGPSGRIVKKDVEGALARGGAAGGGGAARVERATEAAGEMAHAATTARGIAVAPAPVAALGQGLEDRLVPLNNMRGTIARRLVESKTTIPHYQVSVSARMDALLTLREQLNEQLEAQGVKLSVNDFVVRACALAMHEHPFVNSSWAERNGQAAIQLHADVNIGVAIALPMEKGGGLVVATLRGTDMMGLRQISQQTKALAQKARSKGLSIEEMADSTFTISNMGMFGVDHFTAIINPPNAAILAVGQAIEKVFIERDAESEGEVTLTIGHEMTMTMSSDHRIIDGAMAAQYLGTVRRYLENPATLLV